MKTPEQRLANLLHFFGWQGGTIHQLAKETGLDGDTLLYGEPAPAGENHYSHGRLAAEAMKLASREQLLGSVKSDREFWIGVALADISERARLHAHTCKLCSNPDCLCEVEDCRFRATDQEDEYVCAFCKVGEVAPTRGVRHVD